MFSVLGKLELWGYNMLKKIYVKTFLYSIFGVAGPLPWTVPTGSKNAFVRLCLQGLVTFVLRR